MKKIVLGIMIIFGLTMVVSNIVVMYFLLTDVVYIDAAKAIEGTMMTSGLTIISLAITVWLGISIYNAIGKNEIEELKATIETYSPLSEQVREYTKHQLVNQMYKTGDISCDYLAKHFERNDDIPMERYADLLVIDILLQKTYEAKAEDVKMRRLKWAHTGIEKINRYKGKFKKRCELENYYLNYREADFWFWVGGSCEGNKRIDAYKKAKDLFFKSVEDFKIPLTINQADLVTIDEETIRISVYFANAIGQCLVNIMNKNAEGYENLKMEAKKYFEFAINNSMYCGEREVYYRNYGCFIENTACNIAGIEKAYEQYKKAFFVNSNGYEVYYVIISNLNKRLRAMLNIEIRTPQKNRTISIFELSGDEMDNREKISALIDEMKFFIDMAVHLFPENPCWYAFSIYRKIYKICIRNTRRVSDWKKILKSIKQDVTRIEMLQGKSPLCVVAKMEVADIERYCA